MTDEESLAISLEEQRSDEKWAWQNREVVPDIHASEQEIADYYYEAGTQWGWA